MAGNESLRRQLEAADEEFKGTPYPFGMSGMTMTGLTSSRRSTMLTSHLAQLKNPIKPEIPKVFTNMEQLVGKYSSGYKRAKNDLKVHAKIFRYDDSIPDMYNDYTLIVYDKKKDKYKLIQRKAAQNLTENFGFRYDNSRIDEVEVGEDISAGEVLYKSTSYDDDMNYGYGVNGVTMHILDPFVVEDGIVISESFAEQNRTLNVTTHTASINDNDILINVNGDSDHYKPFPDVGDLVKDRVILSKKRIQNDRVLFDMKKSELRKVSFLNNKNLYGSGRVIDIKIFCNKEIEDYEENAFNSQFLKYLKMQKNYYSELYEVLDWIINESGSDYSRDISYYYKVASNYLDPEVKFKDVNGNVFSNYKIVFTLEKEAPMVIGQKLVGRYGNKGVVSDIRPDDEMPILDTGVRVDVLLNPLSPTNRLISAPLYELTITFITNRMGEFFSNNPKLSIKDKEEIFMDIMETLSPTMTKNLREYYDSLSEMDKPHFFDSVERGEVYTQVPILWSDGDVLYDRIKSLYEKYPDILKPYDVYIKKHGRFHKMLGKYTGYVGEMYLLILKHTSQNDFSSRSIGSINNKELPAKTDSAKKHKDLYPKTPIKFGYQESVNLLTSVYTRTLAELHMLYRSSVKGRKDLGERLASDDTAIKAIDNISQYVSRSVEIMNAEFKPIGIKLDFHGDNVYVDASSNKIKTYKTDEGALVIGNREDFIEKAIRDKLDAGYRDNNPRVMSRDEYDAMIETDVEEIRSGKRKKK